MYPNNQSKSSMSREPGMESEQPLFEKNLYNNLSKEVGTAPNTTTADGDSLKGSHTADWSSRQDTSLQARLSALQARLYALAAVSVGGLVVIIVVGAILFARLHSELAHHTHRPTLGAQVAAILQEGMCVPCHEFKLGPSPEEERKLDKYRDESAGGGYSTQCCVDKPGELMDLLKMYIDRQFRLELAKGTVGVQLPHSSQNSKAVIPSPAAHLMLTRQHSDVQHIPGRQQQIEAWLHRGDMTFTAGGVAYDNGGLVVPHDGYYYVYSQISFMEMLDYRNGAYGSIHDRDTPSLSIYLYRYNILYDATGQEKLAQNSITKYVGRSKTFGEWTASIGAVFNLRRQDKLFIKVSNVSLLADDHKSSYFGLFQV